MAANEPIDPWRVASAVAYLHFLAQPSVASTVQRSYPSLLRALERVADAYNGSLDDAHIKLDDDGHGRNDSLLSGEGEAVNLRSSSVNDQVGP